MKRTGGSTTCSPSPHYLKRKIHFIGDCVALFSGWCKSGVTRAIMVSGRGRLDPNRYVTTHLFCCGFSASKVFGKSHGSESVTHDGFGRSKNPKIIVTVFF